MKINKKTMEQELTSLLKVIFQLPEVNKVQIKDIDIFSSNDNNNIRRSIEECYHDILSDIDVGIHVTLHPDDIGKGHGYFSNPHRIGLSRDNYLGLAYSDGGGLCQMFRVILKNGIRFDIGLYITEDSTTAIHNIPREDKDEIKDEGKFWGRWDLAKADSFWFVEIQALAKLLRGDYLIADHLANMQINETLVAQMIDRDDRLGTNFHRYGYHEALDYLKVMESECPYSDGDEIFNMIADKIYAAALTYDRLIKKLNPSYEERSDIFFKIWEQYRMSLNFEIRAIDENMKLV
ncbi:MAG: hypothetical protein GX319_08590 [Clostridiales bacterium]|jgi:hypothetical protein|nr:hypothetical protein [Clostridiales bacterium]